MGTFTKKVPMATSKLPTGAKIGGLPKRLSNGFSKKCVNLNAALNLHFTDYNFCRIHGSLRMTPAMKAGITGHIWSIKEILSFEDNSSEESNED